ncbi:putative chitinase domain protein [Photobacterium leiognathi lrivu.4.1]|uniref:Putative chitinase domain protein n=1 Tax=Photobacterium leiognathi lrivu.4.1 TaxID=1248232 RepID=V5H3K8_PHOLE|nr:putative chitinase domain protein [Photobacterium leiognathi]GAD31622.1 putative chitinase domain protein [Photobacterium leiognathi lrivu.4.1]
MVKNYFRVKNIFNYIGSLCLLTSSSSAAAFYDAYPESEGPYISGPASENLQWLGEDFSSYIDVQQLECSNNKNAIDHFDVTSGCLQAKYVDSWKLGWTDDKVFRVVAIGKDSNGSEIKYTDQTNQYRAFIKTWKNSGSIPAWSGLHAFARYQTSDDLYVGSIRYDGNVTIKVKYQGAYTTLAQTKLTNGVKNYLNTQGKLAAGQWYDIHFSVVGNKLTLALDGVELLSVNNDLLTEGTIGIRTDNLSAYLDDWQLLPSDSIVVDPPTDPEIPTDPETPAEVVEFIPGKTKVINGDIYSYDGQCYQAKNSPGSWEVPSNASWFWTAVECVDNPSPPTDPELPTEPVPPTDPLPPTTAVEFIPGSTKVNNGDTVTYNNICYQAKNSPGSWETPSANSWFWDVVTCP